MFGVSTETKSSASNRESNNFKVWAIKETNDHRVTVNLLFSYECDGIYVGCKHFLYKSQKKEVERL